MGRLLVESQDLGDKYSVADTLGLAVVAEEAEVEIDIVMAELDKLTLMADTLVDKNLEN